MSISTDPSDQVHVSERNDREKSQVRQLRVIATVLATLVLALGGALVATALADDGGGGGGTANAPDEVIEVVENFERAFEEQDDELALSIITEDFLSNSDIYKPNTVKPLFTAAFTPSSLSSEVRVAAFDIERSGELLVAGDGPWVVATRETWIGPFERDEGVRLYVIVEEDGAPKLAGYYYVGTLHEVTPDFGD
jgi:hypothetical protein